jgi:transaldolase
MATTAYKSILHQMTQTTPTALWNDSCAIKELGASIETNGTVGATCNPVIVLEVLKKEWEVWQPWIARAAKKSPEPTEEELAWSLVEEMSINAAKLLKPIFKKEKGRNGRLSIQTNPKYWQNPAKIIEQAERFNALAPNMIVKIPVTRAGVAAIEEATYRGISINATVSFTLPQTIAVAEAVERGLKRREKEGKDVSSMGPVCTIMVGRLDDWLRVVAEKKNIIVDPSAFDWAGVAVMKKAYKIYQQRGYRLRLLSAAMRNHMHWSEFIGGDLVVSPPYKWQERYNGSGIAVKNRISEPVDPKILAALLKFDDFRAANEEKGLTAAQFDAFGATRRTLRQFCKATDDLVATVRDIILPSPD